MAQKNDVLQSATRGASWNVVLQLFFRVFTFALNAVVLRYVTTATLGLANVRLTLLHSTAVFLAREPLRKACLGERVGEGDGNNGSEGGGGGGAAAQLRRQQRQQQATNLSWLQVPIGALTCGLLPLVWLYTTTATDAATIASSSASSSAAAEQAAYVRAVWLYALAALLELASEPFFIFSQARLIVRLRVVAEGVAVVAKGVTLVGILHAQTLWRRSAPLPSHSFWASPLAAFCVAQLAYSAALLAVYLAYLLRPSQLQEAFGSSGTAAARRLFPAAVAGVGAAPPPLRPAQVTLVLSFLKQGVLKHVLTEGERFAMTFLPILTLAEQGLYDVVNNLGSLAARFLFAPIEEAFYTYFAQVVDRTRVRLRLWSRSFDGDAAAAAAAATAAATDAATSSAKAGRTLSTLLQLVGLLGLLVACFGQAYAWLLLQMYGGANLCAAPGPALLRAYCVYVLAMALNGILECFVTAVAPARYIAFYNRLLLGFSAVFVAAVFLFVTPTAAGGWGLGPLGLIAANCANMVLRIAHHIWFTGAFFGQQEQQQQQRRQQQWRQHPLARAVPSPIVLGTLLLSCAATLLSERALLGGGLLAFLVPGSSGIEAVAAGVPRLLLKCAAHVGVGVVLLALFALALWKCEQPFLKCLQQLRRGESGAADEAAARAKTE
jgi:oligosaccharide translocation protein RFT1